MPKSRVIKVKFAPNYATAKSAALRVVAATKKSSPVKLKANNPKG